MLPKKRVRQACDPCRIKKAKCDGELPFCAACASNPSACVYATTNKRRGLPSGYIHDLERKILVFQALFAYLDKDERTKSIAANIESILYNDKQYIVNNINHLQEFWDLSNLSRLVDSFVVDHNKDLDSAKQYTMGLRPSEALAHYNSKTNQHRPSNLTKEDFNSCNKIGKVEDVNSSNKIDINTKNNSNDNHNNNNNNNNNDDDDDHNNTNHNNNNTNNNNNVKSDLIESNQLNSLNPVLQNRIFIPTTTTANTTTHDFNLINDPSLFLKDDIFQYITDELDYKNHNWEPIVLQYDGLSSLISGFSTKAIQQYNNRLTRTSKNPFRVGTLFNISSAAIGATTEDTIRIPSDIFHFNNDLINLIEVYFQIYHPTFPMLNRLSIIGQANRMLAFDSTNDFETNFSFKASDCNLIALLWSISALAKLASNPKNSCDSLITGYVKNAILALENSPICTIETIQAMMILGLYFYQSGDWDYAWVLVSSGARMAIDVKLMSRTSDDNMNEGPKVSAHSASANNINRERTWSCVYILNTILSSRLGRTPLVRAKDWPIPQIIEDGWEEWETWHCYHKPELELNCGRFLSVFNQLIKIISIWNQALTSSIDMSARTLIDDQNDSSLYKISMKKREAQSDRLNEKVKDVDPNSYTLAYFQRILNTWLKELPNYCTFEFYPDVDEIPPFVAFLHLAFAQTWCILAVRLSELRSSNESSTKEHIIAIRNLKYTQAIKMISKLITPESLVMLKDYAFMDYSLIMSIAFPKMMDFDNEEEKLLHIDKMKKLIESASQLSAPFETSFNVYNIMTVTNKRSADTSYDVKPKMTKTFENVQNRIPIFDSKNESGSSTPFATYSTKESSVSQNSSRFNSLLFPQPTEEDQAAKNQNFLKNLGVPYKERNIN